MTDGNYQEAMRVIEEAEHNPAGERMMHQASVRALLAVADEVRALREVMVRLAEATEQRR